MCCSTQIYLNIMVSNRHDSRYYRAAGPIRMCSRVFSPQFVRRGRRGLIRTPLRHQIRTFVEATNETRLIPWHDLPLYLLQLEGISKVAISTAMRETGYQRLPRPSKSILRLLSVGGIWYWLTLSRILSGFCGRTRPGLTVYLWGPNGLLLALVKIPSSLHPYG